MIAGYDYLTVRWRMRRFWTRARVAGAALLITGGLVVGIGAAYYGYAGNARAGLAHYQVQTVEIVPVATAPTRQPQATPAQPAAVRPLPEISLYSGDAGRIPSGPSLPPGFEAIELSQEATLPPAAPATSMRIPRLGIDSPVVELPIVDLGDRRAYQTPDNTIGHIPETANAGETGQGWYFGHTESPVLDQGLRIFQPTANPRSAPQRAKHRNHHRQRRPAIPLPHHRNPRGSRGRPDTGPRRRPPNPPSFLHPPPGIRPPPDS